MLKHFASLLSVLTLFCTTVQADTTIVDDDFESYTSESELLGAWTPFNPSEGFHSDNGTILTTDPNEFYGGQIDGQAAEFCGQPDSSGVCGPVGGAGTVNRWNTPFNIAPSASQKIVLEGDVGDDALSANKRLTIGLRNTTSVENLIELGLYNTPVPGFNYRLQLFNVGGEDNPDWINFNDDTNMDQPLPEGMGSQAAVGAGFHRFRAEIFVDHIVVSMDVYADGLANDPDNLEPGVGTAGVDAMDTIFVETTANGFDDLRFGLPSHLPSSGAVGDTNAAFAAFDNISLTLVDIDGPTESADFDEDGDIDGKDFLAWQQGFGIDDGTALPANGDANGDGNVDGSDRAVWESQFGQVPSALVAASAVPEPSSLGLLAIALAGLGFSRRRN